MMKNAKSLASIAAVLFVAAACSDRASTAPSNARAIEEWRAARAAVAGPIVPGSCTTLSALNALADQVFSAGGPNASSVRSKIDQVDKANKKGDRAKANDAAFNAVRFVFQKFKGPQPLAGTPAQVAKLISDIFCFAGINITVTDPANANLVDPSSTTQVVKSSDSTAGTKLPPASITEPTVLEFTKVPNTFPTPGAGPLNTKLDQYPGFYLITSGNASGTGPQGPVVVAICPDASVPASVRGRLRLGHEKSSGFEITPAADASFLNCPAPAASLLGRVFDKVVSKIAPKALYAAIAREEEFRGGVGGSATEFSPFDPVDPELTFRGGVGGSATEFILSPTPTGITPNPAGPRKRGAANTTAAPPNSQAKVIGPAACPAIEAPWSSPLSVNCRPGIVVKTALGTALTNVPVSWLRVLGGGAIAAEASGAQTCGTFGSTVSNVTDASGRAGVCWDMGATLGQNTVTATPSVGGDAPAGVTFVPAVQTFEATAIKVTPVVATSCPDSVVYNGADQTPCSNTVTDSVHSTSLGSVPVVYGPTSPPRNAGTYTVDASYAGAALYFPATAPQKTFNITKAYTTTTVTCPATVTFTGAPLTPCTASVTGPAGLSQAVTPVIHSNNVNPGIASASATYAGAANYRASTGSANFTITAPPATWSATGPGTTTLLQDGSTGMPSMSYDYDLGVSGGVPTQTWTFSALASSSGTFTQSFSYTGLHAWFAVTAFVHPFVISGGIKTYVAGAVNQGPQNCCVAPSNGFTITGSATFTVAMGDTYGFEIGGSNGDLNSFVRGTFLTARSPLYSNVGYSGGGRNCWHDVTISVVNASTLRWTNGCAPAPVTWLMHATANPNFYTSGPDYPYYATPADVGFTLTFGLGGVIQSITGPSGELYSKIP